MDSDGQGFVLFMKPVKRQKMYHDVVLNTSHDVRHLQVCTACGGLGDRRNMLAGLDAYDLTGINHGKCVVQYLPPTKLLSLPASELNKLSLDDTGVLLMKRLLGVHKERGRSPLAK